MTSNPTRRRGARLLRRGWNAALRLRSGLRLVAENVSPEVRNDLFLAHLSIYAFFSRFTAGRRVLDLGCGTGYGCQLLAERGAASVLGVDADRAAIRYARRKSPSRHVVFKVQDAQRLPGDLGPFDVVVTSNVLEHLPHPERALDGATINLAADGRLLVAVPPIVDGATLREKPAQPFPPLQPLPLGVARPPGRALHGGRLPPPGSPRPPPTRLLRPLPHHADPRRLPVRPAPARRAAERTGVGGGVGGCGTASCAAMIGEIGAPRGGGRVIPDDAAPSSRG